MRQELAHSAWLGAALPALGRPDVIVAVSPSFPALLPTMIDARTKGVPWTLWLQDILPDGAATTGLIRSGPLLTALRGLERIAYRSADADLRDLRRLPAQPRREGRPGARR